MKVRIMAHIYPSEEEKKVVEAVKNVFPTIEIKTNDDVIEGESKDLRSLEKLKNKLGLQAIRDSARREIKKRMSDDSMEFSLNKQAATVDKVSFSYGEAPLGEIDVKIEADNPNEILNYLAPNKKKREG